jgi:hypothetical protein
MIAKPDIVAVIESRGIELRRCGKEFIGLCPFHSEKTPSFTVNVEKNLYHCFGCGEGGDVISFVMKLDNCTFAEAAKSLGVNTDKPTMLKRGPSKEAIAVTYWANAQFQRAQSILRAINQKLRLVQELCWKEEIERLVREFQIISILADDLQTPRYAICLHRDSEQKLWIENLLADAPTQEQPPEFPELTPEYVARLKDNLPKG